MINSKLLLTAGAVALSASFFSTTVTAATETGNATVTVLTPISIVQATAMSFGNVAGDADGPTTVDLTIGGATSSLDNASAEDGSGSAGNFDVTGSGTLAYDISLPLDGVVTLGGPGTAMAVDSFTDSAGGTSSLTAGSDSFSVGATLTINANQTSGAYSGTYDVTVNYQ